MRSPVWNPWHRRDRRVERGILGDLKGLLGGGYNVKRRDSTGSLAFKLLCLGQNKKDLLQQDVVTTHLQGYPKSLRALLHLTHIRGMNSTIRQKSII